MVYQLMERGQLAFVRIGRSRRIPRQALVDLARRHQVKPNESGGK
jgi:excisionase family DNA binding protein